MIDDLRDDVSAHVAIIASPTGFTDGAKKRAKVVGVIPVIVTSDLLGLLTENKIPVDFKCDADCDVIQGLVGWEEVKRAGMTAIGYCRNCRLLHAHCPECGTAFGVTEAEYGLPLKCPGTCGRIYKIDPNAMLPVLTHDRLDIMLLQAAFGNATKVIARGKVESMVNRTKWQYFTEEAPTIALTESEVMVWTAGGLKITPAGEKAVQDIILPAKLPKLSQE